MVAFAFGLSPQLGELLLCLGCALHLWRRGGDGDFHGLQSVTQERKGNARGRVNIEAREAPPDLGRKDLVFNVSPSASTLLSHDKLWVVKTLLLLLLTTQICCTVSTCSEPRHATGGFKTVEMLCWENNMWVSQLKARKHHGEHLWGASLGGEQGGTFRYVQYR